MKIVKKIEPSIFRGYDLRGLVGEHLNEDIYYTLGRSYATFLNKRRIKSSTVGRDNRLSSERFSTAFIKGLNDGGVDTIDIGLSLSQIIYYSSYHFKIKGAAIITASHNPKEYNGLKLGVGYSDTMLSGEIKELKKIADSSDFSTGKGVNRKENIFEAYKKDILRHFNLKNKWKVVVDGCNTGAGVFLPKILRSAGCEVIEQNTKPDGNFPLGTPDPTEREVVERIAEGVLKTKADVGFGYDTDGDRMAVVDNKGNVLWMDTIVALYAKDVLDFMPGSPIVYNTLCSRQVTEAIKEAGGRPVVWLTGHSAIKAKVREERSPFGGELSGHIFFMDNFYGHDDSAYASLRLLSYLERTKQALSDAVGKLSKYVSSPEIKLGLADKIKFNFVSNKIGREMKKVWPYGEYLEIDGIRMDMEDRMVIIRASQNGPYVTIKFEGKTQELYQEMKVKIGKLLKSFPEIDWNQGVNIHAFD